MGKIKDRNGMDLTEAEDIRKRWQEYIEELYKNDLHDPDNHTVKGFGIVNKAASAAAKLLQLCPTLCDPIDSSPPGSSAPRILQARILEWVAISFSNVIKQK